jgi:hypothetical protein
MSGEKRLRISVIEKASRQEEVRLCDGGMVRWCDGWIVRSLLCDLMVVPQRERAAGSSSIADGPSQVARPQLLSGVPRPQQRLNFFPLPQVQGSFRLIFFAASIRSSARARAS